MEEVVVVVAFYSLSFSLRGSATAILPPLSTKYEGGVFPLLFLLLGFHVAFVFVNLVHHLLRLVYVPFVFLLFISPFFPFHFRSPFVPVGRREATIYTGMDRLIAKN